MYGKDGMYGKNGKNGMSRMLRMLRMYRMYEKITKTFSRMATRRNKSLKPQTFSRTTYEVHSQHNLSFPPPMSLSMHLSGRIRQQQKKQQQGSVISLLRPDKHSRILSVNCKIIPRLPKRVTKKILSLHEKKKVQAV